MRSGVAALRKFLSFSSSSSKLQARALGVRTKLYYTIRELSSHAAELSALKARRRTPCRPVPA